MKRSVTSDLLLAYQTYNRSFSDLVAVRRHTRIRRLGPMYDPTGLSSSWATQRTLLPVRSCHPRWPMLLLSLHQEDNCPIMSTSRWAISPQCRGLNPFMKISFDIPMLCRWTRPTKVYQRLKPLWDLQQRWQIYRPGRMEAASQTLLLGPSPMIPAVRSPCPKSGRRTTGSILPLRP